MGRGTSASPPTLGPTRVGTLGSVWPRGGRHALCAPSTSRPVKTSVVLIALLLATASPVRAQAPSDADAVRWTEGVGRMLHGYHAALNAATAAVDAQGGDRPSLYAGGPYDDGWAFSFGELEPDSTFVLRYGVIVSGSGEVAQVDAFDFRRDASPYHALAARALVAVQNDFAELRQSGEFTAAAYRVAVLPFPQGQMTAFVSPAQTDPAATLLGNDVMYTVGQSGPRILERTRFHHRLLALPLALPAGGVAALLVPDAPWPSPVDVLGALERGSQIAVVAGRGVFLIESDGTVDIVSEDDPRARELRRGAGR